MECTLTLSADDTKLGSIVSRAGLPHKGKQATGMGQQEHFEIQQGQMQSPASAMDQPASRAQLGTTWLGSSSAGKTLEVE